MSPCRRRRSGCSHAVVGCLQNKCACYWPKTADNRVYHPVPDDVTTEGRIGVKCVSESEDKKNFTVRELELTREDRQVSIVE